jgi:transcriptional antiterminator
MNRSSDPFIYSLPLKVKTRLEVAEEYGISVRTLSRRLKKSKISLPNGIIFPNQLREIYYILGVPAKINNKNPSISISI